MTSIKVRNKNALLELLRSGAEFEKIVIAEGLDRDDATKTIVQVASGRQIPIEKKPRKKIAKRRGGGSREVLVGFLVPPAPQPIRDLLDGLYERREDPFFVLINRVGFDSNIGVIARTAFAAGVNGLIFQGKEEYVVNEETVHFSLGAVARIPIVKMSIFEAIKELKKDGIKTFSLQMGGTPYFAEDLSGPAAFVLGAEREGISETVASRCDTTLSIPMQAGIDSLNVGVSTSVVLYEKVRQEGKGFLR